MRFLTLVAAFAVAVPVVSHGQPVDPRSGQIQFGGNASSISQQVSGYRVGQYTQELRTTPPVLNGVLTPDFAAIWRAELVQGQSALAHQRVLQNERSNGRQLGLNKYMTEEWLLNVEGAAPPVVPQAAVFNESWLIPGAMNNSGAASPAFSDLNVLPADASTIVNPEPSTYVLMIGGLLAMGVVARRRRARS